MSTARFGNGFLFGIPSGGTAPLAFSALQNISVDFSRDLKMLYGSNQFPLEVAGGKAKIECKAGIGKLDPVLFNNIFFGATVTTGQTIGQVNEAATIPATPYQVTVANAANFRVDLGVYDTTAGIFLTWVTSAPATGQYSVVVATGVYTFAAADTTHNLLISYTYNASTTGKTLTGTNTPLGTIVAFKAVLCNSYGTSATVLTLNKCISSKLSMPFKQDDFMLPAFDFSAQDDGTGTVFTLGTGI